MACAPLTPQEIAALRAKIAEAEAALHSLLLGRQAKVFVDQNGERVEYTSVRLSDLRAYIQELKNLLPDNCTPIYGKPLGFVF